MTNTEICYHPLHFDLNIPGILLILTSLDKPLVSPKSDYTSVVAYHYLRMFCGSIPSK